MFSVNVASEWPSKARARADEMRVIVVAVCRLVAGARARAFAGLRVSSKLRHELVIESRVAFGDVAPPPSLLMLMLMMKMTNMMSLERLRHTESQPPTQRRQMKSSTAAFVDVEAPRNVIVINLPAGPCPLNFGALELLQRCHSFWIWSQ